MLSFDTNVLVYAADRQAGVRHMEAARLIAMAASGPAVLNDQSLTEFLHVMIGKQKQTLADAALMIRAWLKGFALITPHATIIEDTLALLAFYPLSVWDARMLATCERHGCTVLLSEDMSDGMLYGGVRVLNPFNSQNLQTIGSLLTS